MHSEIMEFWLEILEGGLGGENVKNFDVAFELRAYLGFQLLRT